MNAAADEQRNSAAPLKSAGFPHRPSGVRSTIARLRDGSSRSDFVNSVSIHPGAIALTRIPSAAQAIASDLVNCTTPPLLALYAGTYPLPIKLNIDATFRTQPRVSASNGLHAVHICIVAFKFTSTTR